MAIPLEKKTVGTQPKPQPGTIIDGFKVVEPPKSAKEREAMETDDFTGSGGCNTKHHHPSHS